MGCCTLHGLGIWSVAMKGFLKYANCTEETMHPTPKKTWDELLQDGRKKLGMDLATLKKVQVGKDQEKAHSERDSHSKNRGGKKPN